MGRAGAGMQIYETFRAERFVKSHQLRRNIFCDSQFGATRLKGTSKREGAPSKLRLGRDLAASEVAEPHEH